MVGGCCGTDLAHLQSICNVMHGENAVGERAARWWSPRRWLQHSIRTPWRWLYEGCDTCRDTGAAIERAGFSDVQIHRGRLRRSLFVPVNTCIHGVATR